MTNVIQISPGNGRYPALLSRFLGPAAPSTIWAKGNVDILNREKTAFFCSSKCPGDVIIKTYDLAKKWRDDGVTIISGFHSPIEKECLDILLRGSQSLIICPARGIETMRLKSEYEKPLKEDRLLLLSPFPAKERRMTAETALARNRFVAALADNIVVAHAEPGGKIDQLRREISSWGKPFFTFQNQRDKIIA